MPAFKSPTPADLGMTPEEFAADRLRIDRMSNSKLADLLILAAKQHIKDAMKTHTDDIAELRQRIVELEAQTS